MAESDSRVSEPSSSSELGTASQARTIVIARRCGRLANRLILFANLIAYAQRTGARILNPTFYTYSHLFEALKDDWFSAYPNSQLTSETNWKSAVGKLVRTKVSYHAFRHAGNILSNIPGVNARVRAIYEPSDGSVMDLDSSQFEASCGASNVVFLYGWKIRAPRSVLQSSDLIRQFFQPIDCHRVAAEQMIEGLRMKCDVVVGVHLRQGDYRTWLGGKYFFSTSRYRRWMHETLDLYPGQRVGFFVCGDEPHDASEFSELIIHCSDCHYVADLHALSLCDCVIGPLSTFSQWASFSGAIPLLHLRNDDDVIDRDDFSVADLDFRPY